MLICRPAHQVASLAESLEMHGAEVVSVPVIAIENVDNSAEALRNAARNLSDGDWLVVTSPNGAVRAATTADSLAEGVKVAAVGPGTAKSATECGLSVDLIPTRSIAEGLIEELIQQQPARVLLARAAVARSELPSGLRAKGWDVTDIPVYRTVSAALTSNQKNEAASADAVIFTSSSTVEKLVEAIGAERVPDLVVSIGPETTSTIAHHNLHVTVQADEHNLQGVVKALCTHASDHLQPPSSTAPDITARTCHHHMLPAPLLPAPHAHVTVNKEQ